MTLPRKSFLRILGGGIVVAAGAATVAPRLDAMPAAAIEGWRGPLPAETDPRRRGLSWALLAPNPHNLQSWSVDLSRSGTVTVFVDRARLLPQTDPHSRQILIGHGCFLELLSLAAAAEGYRAEIALFPEGDWIIERPVARVIFVRQPGIALDPLFAQIPRRRTVRSAFADRPLEPAHLAALSAAAPSLVIATEPARVDRLRAFATGGSEREMNTPRTHKESIDVLRIGAAQIAKHRDGISLDGPLIWALRQAGMMTAAKAMTRGTMAWDGGRDYALAGYASARAFGWLASPGNARATQIAIGRSYVRLQLQATALGVAMQPHSQTLQEYPEMDGLTRAMRVETAMSEGETLQMFFRLGYADLPGPSPRRELDRIVRA